VILLQRDLIRLVDGTHLFVCLFSPVEGFGCNSCDELANIEAKKGIIVMH
jgi:hypothetical protein